MKKTTTISTTLNGRQVQLTVELELTENDLEHLWQQKEQEYLRSLNGASSFQYNSPTQQPQSSSYTPYGNRNQEDDSPPENQQFDDETSGYTPYASLRRSPSAQESLPKSYVARVNSTYAPYSTFRVNMPEGWEPDSN